MLSLRYRTTTEGKMETTKWIKYNITKSDDLGEGATEELKDAYAEYESEQIYNYLHENYPDYKIEIGHKTNGLKDNCVTSDDDNSNEQIIDEVSNLVENNWEDWLETVASQQS